MACSFPLAFCTVLLAVLLHPRMAYERSNTPGTCWTEEQRRREEIGERTEKQGKSDKLDGSRGFNWTTAIKA